MDTQQASRPARERSLAQMLGGIFVILAGLCSLAAILLCPYTAHGSISTSVVRALFIAGVLLAVIGVPMET